jgi:hypothetical protein
MGLGYQGSFKTCPENKIETPYRRRWDNKIDLVEIDWRLGLKWKL